MACEQKLNCQTNLNCNPYSITFDTIKSFLLTNSEKCDINYTFIRQSTGLNFENSVMIKKINNKCNIYFTIDNNSIYIYIDLFNNNEIIYYNNLPHTLGHHIHITQTPEYNDKNKFIRYNLEIHSTIYHINQYNYTIDNPQYTFYTIINNNLKMINEKKEIINTKITNIFIINLWKIIKCGIKNVENSKPRSWSSITAANKKGGNNNLSIPIKKIKNFLKTLNSLKHKNYM